MLITVTLEAQTGSFVTDVQRASKTAEKELKRMRDESEKALKDFGKIIGAAGVAAAAGLAIMVKGALDSADELGKLSQKTGIAVDDLSKLAYAAKLSDVELDGLQQGLVKLSKSAIEAQSGTGAAADAFKQLGISVNDSEGHLKDNKELLFEVADAFEHLEDGPTKTALALDIFGKSGADLIPLLDDGRKALEDAGAELEKFGGVTTPEAAKAAQDFNDNLTRLETAAQGLANQIAVNLAPDLAGLTERIVDFNRESGKTKDAADKIADGIRGLAGVAIVAANAFQILAEASAANYAALKAVGEGDFSGAWEILKEALADVKVDLNDITHAFDETKKGAAAATPEINAFADPLAALRDIPLPDFKIQLDQIQKAKDLTDAWGLSLEAAREIQDESDKLDTQQRDTTSRQNEIGLNAAADIGDEVQAMQEAEDRKTEIFRAAEEARFRIQQEYLASGSAALGDAMTVAAALGKKGFKAFKAFAIAQALVDTYASATAAFKSLAGIPYVGPALGIAAAGAAVGAGLARVAVIESTEPTGYAEGGLVTGGDQVIRINEQGPEFVINAWATRKHRPVLEAINDGRFESMTAVNRRDTNIIVNNNAPGVTVTARGNVLTVEMIPELLEMVDGDQARRTTSGRGQHAQAIGTKFGLQGRAVR